ncbi:hypothetical protein [Streptomyces sp. NPDC014676]|uniref:hypothetical protein n=1 Tax=Streptomyces sp. NPDC014676 TaxID=3364879 RepID=UPI0036FDCC50
MDDAISAWTARLPHDDVPKLLDDGQIPSGPIVTAAEIAEDPPTTRHAACSNATASRSARGTSAR